MTQLAHKPHYSTPTAMPDHPTPPLTARQQQVLGLVQHAITHTGAPPTRAEIAKTLGFKSANSAEEHLQALARKGVIELIRGTSRGIRLLGGHARTGHNRAEPSDMYLTLPLIGRVAAGAPMLAQEHIENTYGFERNLFAQRPDYLLKVRGLSMRDIGIMDGDLLAVRATPEARNGQIVVARLDDEVTVKRFRRTAQTIELLAENPDFAPITVRPGEPFAIEGLVVGLIRNQMPS